MFNSNLFYQAFSYDEGTQVSIKASTDHVGVIGVLTWSSKPAKYESFCLSPSKVKILVTVVLITDALILLEFLLKFFGYGPEKAV